MEILKRCLATLVMACALVAPVHAANTMKLEMGTLPVGPNASFTVEILLEPANVDIAGFSVLISYDNTQISFDSITNNTGATGPSYAFGNEVTVNGVNGVNVSRVVNMDAVPNLTTPSKLGLIQFTTTPGFNVDPEDLAILISANEEGGPGGLIDGSFEFIPTEYTSINPNTAVRDWNLY